MARRLTKKEKQRQKRIVKALGGLLALVVLTTALYAVPNLEERLYDLFGITQKAVVPQSIEGAATSLHFIDVGQGDAVLIEQDGEFALIDAGTPEGREGLLAYLNGLGVETLRYVIMTHPHADHIGGMQAVVENYTIGQVVLPSFDKAPLPTTSTFERLLQALVDRQLDTVTGEAGMVLPLGSGTITVIQDGVTTSSNLNHLSLMLLFEAEGIAFLATGDAEKENEAALIETGAVPSVDVFHAGHHGSSTSNTEGFLSALRPAIVVVSCGKDNSYGHPHREALASFAAVDALVLRTDLHGAVVVQPDGEGGLAYATEREA